jgi:hypothetical protein
LEIRHKQPLRQTQDMAYTDLRGDRGGGFEPTLSTFRKGALPRTARLLPHRQLDQLATPAMYERLLELCGRALGIGFRESRLASRDTIALWGSGELAKGPADAFIDDHEFCHIHSLPEGSIHLTLPRDLARQAVALGWAEPHILARSGLQSGTLVMVYAPRDEEDLQSVWRLIMASYRFAMGE